MRRFFHKLFLYLGDQFASEQNRYVAVVPFLFALGIAIYFSLPVEPNLWIILGLVELLLLGIYLLRRTKFCMFLIGLAIVLFGFVNIEMQTAYHNRKVLFPPHEAIYLKGHIKDISQNNKGKVRLLLTDLQNEDDLSLVGDYRITASSVQIPFEIGDCVEMVATVFPPSQIPVMNGYQLNRKYFYEGLSAIGYVNSEIFQIKCARSEKSAFQMQLNKLRYRISSEISEILPPATAGVVDALLIGEKSHLLPQISENYRDAGLAHFLSVSGLHLGSIAALFFFLIRLIVACIPALALRYDSKKIAAVFAILFSGFYLLISGMAVPAQRAFIMTTTVLIGVIFNRRAISIRMVGFAALFILIISPQALISISFQMSFAAVYALVAFYETYAGKLTALGKNRGFVFKVFWYLAGIVLCDLVASLATLPFSVYHFHRVAVYTSLGNLLAGPLIGLYLMPIVLLSLLCLPFGLAAWPIKFLGYGVEILNRITDDVAHLPHSVLQIDSLSFGGFMVIVIGGYWLCVLKNKWRQWGCVLILIGLLSMLLVRYPEAIIAPDGKGVAIRTHTGEMIFLPVKIDSWTKQIWQQNFAFGNLSPEEDKKLKNALIKGSADFENYALKCSKNECIYHEKIRFLKNGELLINHQKQDLSAGGYIYEQKNGEVQFVPLWNKKMCRPWQKCENKTHHLKN